MAHYYKASGRFSPMSFFYFIMVSLIVFPLLGLIYAYCIWYIPFIYINFIIAAGFGFGVGLLIKLLVVDKGKVRNPMLATLFGVLGGFIALYFHWTVWVDLVINAEGGDGSVLGVTVSNIKVLQVFSLAAEPGILWDLIQEINEYGTWGIGSSTVSGIFLTIIWIVETLIIVGIATFIPIPKSRTPFCERDNVWFKEEELPAFTFIHDKEKVVVNLEKGNPQSFDVLDKVENVGQDHSIFTLYTSEHGETYLSIENKQAKVDKDGKLDFDDDEVVEYISLSDALKEVLLAK